MLHENDPGLTIGCCSAKHGLVSVKLHIWKVFASHLKYSGNVVVVLLTLLWIRGCLGLGGSL